MLVASRIRTRRKARRQTKAERRARAEAVEKGVLLCALGLAYYTALGKVSDEAIVLSCALCALIFAAVSFCMLVFFAFAGRRANALCWLLSFCASCLVFVRLW